MAKPTSPKLIAEFNKNSSEIIRVQLTTYENTNLLDIRAWIQSDKGNFIPTRKGLTLRVEQVDDLKQAIDKAAKEIEKDETA